MNSKTYLAQFRDVLDSSSDDKSMDQLILDFGGHFGDIEALLESADEVAQTRDIGNKIALKWDTRGPANDLRGRIVAQRVQRGPLEISLTYCAGSLSVGGPESTRGGLSDKDVIASQIFSRLCNYFG